MKKHFWMALALFMSVETADVSAQSFLKKLKQKVEVEVENRVTNEARKHVDKVVDKVGEAVTGSKSESNSRQSNASQSQSQSDDIYTTATKKVTVTAIDPMVERGPITGKHNGHEWIDLGLPSGLKWATSNVGTDEIDQDGIQFSWGGTIGWYEKKRATHADPDEVQHDITGDKRYDAATARWSDAWFMPTLYDYVELMENCTFEWTNLGRREGLKVTSKHNGKYIFLPASGKSNGDFKEDVNELLTYWTSSHIPGWQNKMEAYGFKASKTEAIFRSENRWTNGYSIRAVTK